MRALLTVVAIALALSNTNAQTKMNSTITKTINIHATPDTVWHYVNDLSKWADWAIHNVHHVKPGENGYWQMEGPRGISLVKMNGHKEFGILDHVFIDPAEGHWNVPCRVVAGNEGAHFSITFTKPAPMPDEAFAQGMKLFDEELLQLKQRLEKQSPFTIEQISAAHSKVRSGADFPQYIRDLKQLGVVSYQTYVADGHTDYAGTDNYQTSSAPKYDTLTVANTSDAETFKNELKAHQQGKSDYPTFCKQCAESGIEKWIVSLEKMTCTYYDKAGHIILVETIPG